MAKEDTQFKGEGKGIRHGQQPISVKFSANVDAVLRGMCDRSEYIRQAVEGALKRDGLL